MARLWQNWLRQRRLEQGRKAARSVRLGVETLEDRCMLSWGGTPPSTLPASDLARYSATVTLNGQGDAAGSDSITNNLIDAFRVVAATSGSYTVQTTTPYSSTDTVLGIYNINGQRVAYNDDITWSNTDSRVTFTATAGSTFYFCITNYTGTPNGSYSWSVDGPSSGGSGADDRYEENDSMGQATYLGSFNHSNSLGGTVSGLAMRDSADWFRFSLAEAGRSGDSLSISFTHAQGDLDIGLFNSAGQILRSSTGVTNAERIDLSGLAAGTYYLRVYGYQGVHNPSYSLSVNMQSGGGGGGGGTQHRTLYLDFDGERISRSALATYANGEWLDLNGYDPDGNGINVSSFIANRVDREQVISQIFTHLRQDLQPFGISVQRVSSVVAGVGATTVLVGMNDEPNRGNYLGLASDIDVGNVNRTDIAMATGTSQWFGLGVNDLALRMADLILHEAGHTWGLWHVNAPSNAREAMAAGGPGLQAGINLTFENQAYARRDSTGPAQNSYQYLYQVFVTNSYRPMAAFGGMAAMAMAGAGGTAGGSLANALQSIVVSASDSTESAERAGQGTAIRYGLAASGSSGLSALASDVNAVRRAGISDLLAGGLQGSAGYQVRVGVA